MVQFAGSEMLLPGLAGVVLACTVVLVLVWLDRRQGPDAFSGTDPTAAVIWFRDGKIVDANLRATTELGLSPLIETRWTSLASLLRAQFPELTDVLPSVRTVFRPKGMALANEPRLIVIPDDGGHIVSIQNSSFDSAETDDHQDPLPHYNHGARHAPCLIWRVDATGQLLWVNQRYKALAETCEASPDTSPLITQLQVPVQKDVTRRVSVHPSADDKPHWFDVSALPDDAGVTFFGIEADGIVKAEAAQRNFVQTLTKTFAQLSIGLAFFDRNRQLALFNPALIDLTGLRAEFLSARPSLMAFFDRLRENQMMPEPKNYSSWREHIAALVVAAADDRYAEVWTLTSGLTYRVTGRPHPDGAIAFLIEDISAEISLTRRFRSEIETTQSVLDLMDEALAIFSPAGVLSLANRRYRDYWGVDPDSAFADVTLTDSIAVWSRRCGNTACFGKLADFVARIGDRNPWSAHLECPDGARITMAVTPVSGGATLVSFALPLAVVDRPASRPAAPISLPG